MFSLPSFLTKHRSRHIPSVPFSLHYDKKAFFAIKRIAEGPDDIDAQELDAALKALNFTDGKIDKIKVRCKELYNYLVEAEKKARAFYVLCGWTGVKAQFLLDDAPGEDGKSDYEKIESITDLSVDPGNTYLSIDNEHYLFGVKEFAEKNSKTEIDKALNAERKKQWDKKRLNNPSFATAKNENTNRQIFLNNPLRGKMVS